MVWFRHTYTQKSLVACVVQARMAGAYALPAWYGSGIRKVKRRHSQNKVHMVQACAAVPVHSWYGMVQAGSGQNIEKQNIKSQNIERKISKAKYRSRKISKSQNIEVAEYRIAKYRMRKISK